MVVFIRSISDNWLWLAALLALLSLWFFRQAVLARREWRHAIFGLEREQARRRTFRDLRLGLFMLLLIAGLNLANEHLVPLLPEPEDRRVDAGAVTVATITPTPTATPWISQPAQIDSASAPAATATPTSAPSPTITPTVDATPAPTATPAPQMAAISGCGHPGVSISSPVAGSTVSGTVTINGVASIEGFQFYKVEIGQGDNPAAYSVLSDVRLEAVNGGTLETWNTGPYPAGPYWLRLVVVDQTGNFPQPCSVRVVVSK